MASHQVDWDKVLNASSDEDDVADSELSVWQQGFWCEDTDSTDSGGDEVDAGPLLVEGFGISCNLPSAVPDGRSILLDDDLPKEAEKTKSFYVVREIVTSERSYLKGLHLVEKAFHGAIKMHNLNIKEIIPETDLRLIFSNIAAIYELSLELLIQLEQRLEKWEERPQIADIFVTRAPFLKMYSLYSADFERSQSTLAEWMRKSEQLSKIVRLIESSRLSCGLTIPSYMLYPIQRVPRYRLLLQNYLGTLEESNADYADTMKALELIEEVATHMENQIDKLANFQKVVKIQRSLCGKGAGTLVQPGREILLTAPAKQAKRRGQGHKQRVLYLFSDILVIAHVGKTFGGSYKISNILQLRDVKLSDVGSHQAKQFEASHMFNVTVSGRTYSFTMGTEADKVMWMKGIERATSTETEKKTSFLAEYSRTSASHLSVLLNDPDIKSELKRYTGVEATQHLLTLQQRLRSKLAGLTSVSSYSPATARRSPRDSPKPVIKLISAPTHISETGLLDPTTLGLGPRSRARGWDSAAGDRRDGEVEDGGLEEVDFGETLLAPFGVYVWVRRFSANASPWKQMWCQLCGLWIYCFDDHQVGRKPFGCIPLAGYRLAESSVPLCFGLQHPVKPTFELRFDNHYDFTRWVSVLTHDLDKYLLEEVLATVEV